jgi:hypothetical protein
VRSLAVHRHCHCRDRDGNTTVAASTRFEDQQ